MSKVSSEPWTVHRDPDFERREAMARHLERVAWLMDRAFGIPGTKVRVGLDAILGLLPVGGDFLTGLVQVGLVLVALRHYRVPKTVAARMAGNVLLDIAVGTIPLLGDLFDVGFKANTRNIRLLDEFRQSQGTTTMSGRPGPSMIEQHRVGMSWKFLVPIGIGLAVVLTLVLVGFVTVVRWLFSF